MQNLQNNRSKNLIFGTSKATRGAFYKNMNLQKSTDPDANRADIVVALRKTSWFERLWYPIFILAGLLCLIFIRPITFELCFAVVSLFLYMISNHLFAKGKLSGLIIGIISSSLYTVVCVFSKVFGEVAINLLLYIPLDIIAVFTFRKNINTKTDEINIKAMTLKHWILTILTILTGTAALFCILHFVLHQIASFTNALSICLFLTATFVRNLRFKEFWWFDMLGNAVTIIMWFLVTLSAPDMIYNIPFIISTFAATLNNIYGIISWKMIYRKNINNGGIYIKKQIKINHVIKVRRRYNKALKWNKEVEEKHAKQMNKN